jgi:hypothetical protein
LVRALAAQAMLNRRLHGARVTIGVAKNAPSGIAAHAWVICGGRIVIGGSTPNSYSALTTL